MITSTVSIPSPRTIIIHHDHPHDYHRIAE